MECKYSDLFSIRASEERIPPIGTPEFNKLVELEVEKCLGGVTIDGVFISGWLYWHTQHWKIRIDAQDEHGNDIRIEQHPDLRDNEWIRVAHLEECRIQKKGYMEVGLRQGGKALLNSSKLYYDGYEKSIGECSIGDRIYDDGGNLTTITNKFPQGIRPVYKITLADGREILCDLNHKWKVYNRLSKKYDVKNTEDLLVDYRKERPDWKGVRQNSYEFKYSIPCNDAVKYSEKELPIDPYVLGLWLGDGSSSYSKITTIDKEIIDYLYNYANKVGLQITVDDVDTFMITSGRGVTKTKSSNFIHEYLKPLYNNKHIPEEYFYASIEQRMEVLRGLMDSDGSCDKRGKIEFSSSIPLLAKDFYNLCRSLGINLSKTVKPTFYKKNGIKINCKESSRFILYTNKPVFKLSRKLERICQTPKYLNHTAITNIEYQYEEETTCITVDNDSHLFLTDNYTVTHNSELEASFLAYNAILFRNSQNVIVGGNDNDLNLLKDKVDFGLKALWEGISIPRIDKTWRHNSIRLGYKKKDGDDDIWSFLIIRNAADGSNTETAAGTTAKSYIMDEVGKYSFGKVFEAAKPAFISKFGWRAIPLLVGTGGSFDKGADAERFFYNPESNNFLAVTHPESGEKTALFMSGIYRQDCKKPTTLGDYLVSTGKSIPKKSDLFKIRMDVADEEKALATIHADREQKKDDPDFSEYLKSVMYFPLTPEECFLTVGEKIFNTEAAKAQQKRIRERGITGSFVEFFNDGEEIKWKAIDTKPISSFPHTNKDNLDAPAIMWEAPIKNAPWGTYVAGVDSYRQVNATTSKSLGTIYIYKRMYDIMAKGFQNTFVCSYSARPNSKDKWEEQARLIIKAYNARTLVENDEISFIDYMKSKGDERYLEPEPQFLKALITNSTVNRKYGIHRSAEKIRNFLHSSFKKFTETVIDVTKAEDGSIINEYTGFSQIYDYLLLEEIGQYTEKLNADRIIAAELAVVLANHLDNTIGTANVVDARSAGLYGRKKSSTFTNKKSLFTNSKKLF